MGEKPDARNRYSFRYGFFGFFDLRFLEHSL